MQAKLLQIEGLTAFQFFEAVEKLSREIKTTKTPPAPPPPIPQTEWMTKQEVADLLKVSLVTVSDWTKKGFLPCYRIGQLVRFKRAEVETSLTPISTGKGGRRK